MRAASPASRVLSCQAELYQAVLAGCASGETVNLLAATQAAPHNNGVGAPLLPRPALHQFPGLQQGLSNGAGQEAGQGKKAPLVNHKLSGTEMTAVRQLITGYRESAAFLLR